MTDKVTQPTQQETPSQPVDAGVPRESLALMIGISGWLLPGLGHALQRMWG